MISHSYFGRELLRKIELVSPILALIFFLDCDPCVYPRDVVVRALVSSAPSAVLAHNHPSGNARASRADEAITQTLKAALTLVDVRVLDHFIVTATQSVSMAEQGLI